MEKFHLLWVDLETTGSDLETSRIIEAAVIITDYDLNELEEFSSVIGNPGMINLITDPYVKKMHTENGLIDDLNSGKGITEYAFETTVVSALEANNIKAHQIALAGSGVGHFDRRFLARDMPGLSSYLKYFVIDVGVMRRAIQMAGQPDLWLDQSEKTHRALDDVRFHLKEMRHFTGIVGHMFTTYPMMSVVKDYNKKFMENYE